MRYEPEAARAGKCMKPEPPTCGGPREQCCAGGNCDDGFECAYGWGRNVCIPEKCGKRWQTCCKNGNHGDGCEGTLVCNSNCALLGCLVALHDCCARWFACGERCKGGSFRTAPWRATLHVRSHAAVSLQLHCLLLPCCLADVGGRQLWRWVSRVAPSASP